MKKWILAGLLLFGLSATAQRMQRDWQGRKQMPEFSTDEMAALQSKQMTLALDLSTAQEQQLQQLLAKRIADRRERWEAHQKDTIAMADPHQRYVRMSERLDREIAFRRELRKVLGEASYEQWKVLHPARSSDHNRSGGMGHHPDRKHHKG